MLSGKILVISATKRDDYMTSLQRKYDVLNVSSGKLALQYANKKRFDCIVLDAVSMRISGERVCRSVQQAFPDCPVVHIHPGPDDQADKIADVTLFQPFTSRKLMGVINRLIRVPHTDMICCGPFQMNPATRILVAHGRELQLNPKQADLIKLFLMNPNQVMDRETIMKKVWKTSYMGDTRTLDVHIRWVRKALENGNKGSHYLKTVRGVGYCLEIDSESQ